MINGVHEMNGIFTELISLATGVLTGVVFERRATRRAEQSNAVLEQSNEELERSNESLDHQVEKLRRTVLSLGGDLNGCHRRPEGHNLSSSVIERAMATQDPTGRVSRRALRAHFLQSHTADEVDAAIESICRAGNAKEDGQWFRMMS